MSLPERALISSAEGQPHWIIRREDKFLGEELSKMFNKRRGTRGKYPAGPDAALLMGGRTAGIGGGPWTCVNPDHWLYEGVGMKEGDMVEGLIGWEWHGSPAENLPGMEIVARGETKNGGGKLQSPHVAMIYDGPKGNVVFNAGTIWRAQGLSAPPGHVLPAHKAAKPQGRQVTRPPSHKAAKSQDRQATRPPSHKAAKPQGRQVTRPPSHKDPTRACNA